jgi:GNAT superfamily N-acetyltransferase
MRKPLLDAYEYEWVERSRLIEVFNANRARVFAGTFYLNSRDFALSEAELEAVRKLGEKLSGAFEANCLIYLRNQCVGWSFGRQESAERYYMINTGILPEHQNRGIYSALLPVIVKRVLDEGFQVIHSRHNATNNRVIVPKLKAGFVISGLELSDIFGTLVHLSYFANKLRRQAMDTRSGQALPSPAILQYLGLKDKGDHEPNS